RGTVRLLTRFLDDVIDVNRYPTPEVERATRATRKIGVGVMGLAELLAELAIPYDSDEAIELATSIARVVRDEATKASEELAAELEVAPEWHLRMQAAFQRFTDAAVSKTINLPSSASVEDVEAIYLDAWRADLKGITIYRYGSKESQVLTVAGDGERADTLVEVG